jgi:hypothetical protein
MKFPVLSITLLALGSLLCTHAMAQDGCPVKAKLKTPTAFLIDKDNHIVKGPIDFGTVEKAEGYATDYEVKGTDYRLLLFPARVSVDAATCNLCLNLKIVAPLCPNSTTFEVGVGMELRGRPGAVTPYPVDDKVDLRFIDKKLDYEPTVTLAFDARVVGILVTK